MRRVFSEKPPSHVNAPVKLRLDFTSNLHRCVEVGNGKIEGTNRLCVYTLIRCENLVCVCVCVRLYTYTQQKRRERKDRK